MLDIWFTSIFALADYFPIIQVLLGVALCLYLKIAATGRGDASVWDFDEFFFIIVQAFLILTFGGALLGALYRGGVVGEILYFICVVCFAWMLVPYCVLVLSLAVLVNLLSFVKGIHYVCVPHPAARIVKASRGQASDHRRLAHAIKVSQVATMAQPPKAYVSRNMKRKAEELAALTERYKAERELLESHEGFVREQHRRKRIKEEH